MNQLLELFVIGVKVTLMGLCLFAGIAVVIFPLAYGWYWAIEQLRARRVRQFWERWGRKR